jgi:hypothetical protein
LNLKNCQRSSDVQIKDCFSIVKEQTRENDSKAIESNIKQAFAEKLLECDEEFKKRTVEEEI